MRGLQYRVEQEQQRSASIAVISTSRARRPSVSFCDPPTTSQDDSSAVFGAHEQVLSCHAIQVQSSILIFITQIASSDLQLSAGGMALLAPPPERPATVIGASLAEAGLMFGAAAATSNSASQNSMGIWSTRLSGAK